MFNKTPSEPGLTYQHRKPPVYLLYNNTFNSFSQSWELKQKNNKKTRKHEICAEKHLKADCMLDGLAL